MDFEKSKLLWLFVFLMANVVILSCSASTSPDECTHENYSKYKKVVANVHSQSEKDQFTIIDDTLNGQELENIIFVLEFYRKNYKVLDGQLLIGCELWRNKDLLANIHKKSNDGEWLKSHGKK